jgi:hypothetical protein
MLSAIYKPFILNAIKQSFMLSDTYKLFMLSAIKSYAECYYGECRGAFLTIVSKS